jgi:uncharacterized protein (TIGR02300 family)
MPAKDLGTKHACYKCGAKFYDLKKPVPACPKCGTDQREQPPPRLSSQRRPASLKLAEEPIEAPELDEEVVEAEPEDEADDAEEDS